MVLGGLASGGWSFLIFLPLDQGAGLLVQAAAAASVTGLAMGTNRLAKKTGVFLVLTFLAGGVTMALLLWQGRPSLMGNGVLFMEAATYGKVAVCGAAAGAVCRWFIGLVRQQRAMERAGGDVELELEDRVWVLPGFVDSGNGLREPLTGKPVILIDEKGRKKIGIPWSPEAVETLGQEKEIQHMDFAKRMVVIPYQAVGTPHGMLMGIRLDCVRFRGRTHEGAVLAFYEGSFRGFDVLLNQDILEGGIVEDV